MSAHTLAPPATSSARATVVGLARVEGGRLLRNPLVLAGAALSTIILYGPKAILGESPDIPYIVWTGLATYPVAAGTLLASMLAVLRSRRNGTDELYETTPTSAADRTLAHLLAVTAPVVITIALLAGGAALHGLWNGTSVPFEDGRRLVVPGLLELAQGPAVVVLFGVVGVALARWLPTLVTLPFVAVALLFHFVSGSWGIGGTARWLLPYVNHEVTARWVQVSSGSGYAIVDRFQSTELAWHVAYLLSLAVAVGAVAVARHRRDRAVAAVATVALAVAVITGVVQLP